MGYAESYTCNPTTNAGGAATAFTNGILSGRIQNIIYTQDGTNPYSGGATVTVTTETTGQAVWSATLAGSVTVAPRQATHDTAGAAALYAAGGTAVRDRILAVQERLKFVIAGGGNTKTGAFVVIVGQ